MIHCHLHDYVEIACLYSIKIKLTLKNKHVITGFGKTIRYNNNKDECLMIETKDGNIDIVLTDILTMIALDANPHFKKVTF